MKRRDFLATFTSAAILAAANPLNAASDRRTLLVIELAGGNDGLNAFIPYADSNYLRLRPTLGIKDGIPVSSNVALHPALQDLKPLFDRGQIAVVQNVGYPNPSLSHFRSKDIWQSAQVRGSAESGWLARYLEAVNARPADAVFLGQEYPLALMGDKGDRYLQLSAGLLGKNSGKLAESIRMLYDAPQESKLAEEVRRVVLESQAAVRQLAGELSQRLDNASFPKTAVGKQFALASHSIGKGPKVVYLTVGGWDTHVGQARRQQQLLEEIGKGLAALDRDLRSRGLEKNVLVMVQSEFGRRPAQNGSGGTDHGTAGPVILLGNVRGGFYGGMPALDSLVDGNLPVQVDFRRIYAEILQRWQQIDAKPILAENFSPLGFL